MLAYFARVGTMPPAAPVWTPPNSHATSSTVPATCKKRKDGAATSLLVHAKSKAGHPPNACGLSSLISDVVHERQRCPARRHWAGGKNFPDGICELQCYRRTICKKAGIVVQLRQRHDVVQHRLDGSIAAANFNRQRVRHLEARVGSEPRRPAACPQCGIARIADEGSSAKDRSVTISE